MADTQKPWLNALLNQLEQDKEAIENEIGPFTWKENEPYEEIMLLPQDGRPGAWRCYLVATGQDPRIVIDDYWPLSSERE